MSDLARFFKHSAIYAVGNILNRVGAFLLLPVYTNYLSVEEYGILELFYLVMAVISGVLAAGLAHATLRFYFDYKSLEEKKESISTNYIGSFVISLFFAILIAFFASDLSEFVFSNEALTTGVYLILITLVFELSSQICLAYVRAIEYSIFFVVISILKLILQVSLNIYLVIYLEVGIEGVLFGNLCAVFLGWLILSYFTLSHCGFKFNWQKFVPVLHYCAPFLLATIMALIATNADKFILNKLISLEALGLYALAIKFSMILEQLIGEPFSRSYGAFRYTIMDNEGAADLQEKIVRYLTVLIIFAGLGLSFYSKDLIYVMSDEAFWPAADLIPLLMVSATFKILIYPAQTGVLYAKKTKYILYFTSISAVVNVVGSYSLISYIGIYGACLSLILTDFIVLLVTHKISQKFFEVTYQYHKLFLAYLTAFSLYLFQYYFVAELSIANLFIKAFILLIYLALIIKMGVINKDDIFNIRQFINSKLGR